MTATYTFDVFSTLDGYGSYTANATWGGYWGKQGPEFLDHRLALYSAEQRMVFGANTYRQFAQVLGSSTEPDELDPVNARMRGLPGNGGVVDAGRTPRPAGRDRRESATRSRSSPGSRRSPRCRCARTAACR